MGGWGRYTKAEWLGWVMSEDTRRQEARAMGRQDREGNPIDRWPCSGGSLAGAYTREWSSAWVAWNGPGCSPPGARAITSQPRIRTCGYCDDPNLSTVCPICDLPCCRACQDVGLCCTSPEAEGGRLRLALRRQGLPPDRAG